MIAQELEVSLHMAFVEARQKRHEFITVEHLLLTLLDNPSAAEVLRACAVDIESLRKELLTFINEHTPTVAGIDEIDTQPTLGFQRVIQRAILHVQSSGKKEVTGANVLVAIFGEKDSHAVFFLQRQNVTRLDVVNYISHGITKTPQPRGNKEEAVETDGEAQQPEVLDQLLVAEPHEGRTALPILLVEAAVGVEHAPKEGAACGEISAHDASRDTLRVRRHAGREAALGEDLGESAVAGVDL